MSNAIIHMTVVSRRMLTRKQAADHCGRTVKQFNAECPVVPVRIGTDMRYDVEDLNKWLDGFKHKGEDSEAILSRL